MFQHNKLNSDLPEIDVLMQDDPDIALPPCVLLVDDYDANILVASTYVESFGFQCDVAKNGLDAIERVKSRTYFAILMDIQMPMMDGMEATTHIRNLERELGRNRQPIIAMTAYPYASSYHERSLVGMDAYIAKPFDPKKLQLILEGLSRNEKGEPYSG